MRGAWGFLFLAYWVTGRHAQNIRNILYIGSPQIHGAGGKASGWCSARDVLQGDL